MKKYKVQSEEVGQRARMGRMGEGFGIMKGISWDKRRFCDLFYRKEQVIYCEILKCK